MIAVLRIPGCNSLRRVELPAAPIPGDVLAVDGRDWRVTDRRFVVAMDSESEVVLTVEAA